MYVEDDMFGGRTPGYRLNKFQDRFPFPPSAFFHLLAPFADAYFYPDNEWNTSDEGNNGDDNIVRELHGGRW